MRIVKLFGDCWFTSMLVIASLFDVDKLFHLNLDGQFLNNPLLIRKRFQPAALHLFTYRVWSSTNVIYVKGTSRRPWKSLIPHDCHSSISGPKKYRWTRFHGNLATQVSEVSWVAGWDVSGDADGLGIQSGSSTNSLRFEVSHGVVSWVVSCSFGRPMKHQRNC